MRALKTLLTLSLLYSSIYAEEVKQLDLYISKDKNKQFLYDYQKNDADGSKLRDSWISPLNLKYSHLKSNANDTEVVSKTTSINMDQSIFRSGGIYYAIKYAEASLRYGNHSVDVIKQKLIKDAISLLMQIKQVDLKIQKQNFLIANTEINLKVKKEQYLNGQLDSNFLDTAIIERNSAIASLYDIETSKERLISSFETISDLDYKNAKIPTLRDLTKDDFLNNNIILNMYETQNNKNYHYKDMTVAKYLPSVNVIAGYNWNKLETKQLDTKDDYYNYGFKVTMPLDINTFKDIESSKVDYLKSQLNIKDKKRVMVSLYDQVTQNISNFKKKIELSTQNKEIYQKLLVDTKKLYEVGYKTEYDVEVLSNSFEIQNLDIKVLEIDKQLELLSLYESYKRSE
ncbi:MAG: TolC family protein [Campylobacterota bacterium]|nr:TolC family protein [Campylobacterota bacterium]